MAGAKAAHHDAEGVKAQGAQRKVARPPGADGQEHHQVDAGEGRRMGYAYRGGGGGHRGSVSVLAWPIRKRSHPHPHQHLGSRQCQDAIPYPRVPRVPASASSTMTNIRPEVTSNQCAVIRKRGASHSLRLVARAGAPCSPAAGAASMSSSSC